MMTRPVEITACGLNDRAMRQPYREPTVSRSERELCDLLHHAEEKAELAARADSHYEARLLYKSACRLYAQAVDRLWLLLRRR